MLDDIAWLTVEWIDRSLVNVGYGVVLFLIMELVYDVGWYRMINCGMLRPQT